MSISLEARSQMSDEQVQSLLDRVEELQRALEDGTREQLLREEVLSGRVEALEKENDIVRPVLKALGALDDKISLLGHRDMRSLLPCPFRCPGPNLAGRDDDDAGRGDKQELMREIDTVQHTVMGEVRKIISSHKARLEAFEARVGRKQEALANAVNDLADTIAAHSTDLTHLTQLQETSAQSAKAAEVEAWEGKKDRWEEALDGLQGRVETMEPRVAAIETRTVPALRDRIAKAEKADGARSLRHDAAAALAGSVQAGLADLSGRVANEIASLTERVGSLEATLEPPPAEQHGATNSNDAHTTRAAPAAFHSLADEIASLAERVGSLEATPEPPPAGSTNSDDAPPEVGAGDGNSSWAAEKRTGRRTTEATIAQVSAAVEARVAEAVEREVQKMASAGGGDARKREKWEGGIEAQIDNLHRDVHGLRAASNGVGDTWKSFGDALVGKLGDIVRSVADTTGRVTEERLIVVDSDGARSVSGSPRGRSKAAAKRGKNAQVDGLTKLVEDLCQTLASAGDSDGDDLETGAKRVRQVEATGEVTTCLQTRSRASSSHEGLTANDERTEPTLLSDPLQRTLEQLHVSLCRKADTSCLTSLSNGLEFHKKTVDSLAEHQRKVAASLQARVDELETRFLDVERRHSEQQAPPTQEQVERWQRSADMSLSARMAAFEAAASARCSARDVVTEALKRDVSTVRSHVEIVTRDVTTVTQDIGAFRRAYEEDARRRQESGSHLVDAEFVAKVTGLEKTTAVLMERLHAGNGHAPPAQHASSAEEIRDLRSKLSALEKTTIVLTERLRVSNGTTPDPMQREAAEGIRDLRFKLASLEKTTAVLTERLQANGPSPGPPQQEASTEDIRELRFKLSSLEKATAMQFDRLSKRVADVSERSIAHPPTQYSDVDATLISNLSQKLSDIERAGEDKEQQVLDLASRVDALAGVEKTMQDLAKRVAGVEKERQTSNEDGAKADKTLSKRVKVLASSLATLHVDVAALGNNLRDSIKDAVDTAQLAYQKSSNVKSLNQGDLAAVSALADSLREEKRATDGRLGSVTQSIAALAAQVDSSNVSIRTLQEQLHVTFNGSNERFAELSAQVAQSQQRDHHSRSDADRVTRISTSFSQRVSDADPSNDDAVARLSSVETARVPAAGYVSLELLASLNARA
eukprot:gene7689-11798_t